MVYLQNKTALLLLFFRDSDTIFCSFIIHSTSSATGKREDILGILLLFYLQHVLGGLDHCLDSWK